MSDILEQYMKLAKELQNLEIKKVSIETDYDTISRLKESLSDNFNIPTGQSPCIKGKEPYSVSHYCHRDESGYCYLFKDTTSIRIGGVTFDMQQKRTVPISKETYDGWLSKTL